MNVFVTALGCRLNEAELQSWSRALAGAGHTVVGRPEYAHVLVLNTCAVTGEAARKSRQHIRRLRRQNPSAPLVVTGCYAQLEPDRVAALAGVDRVVGNADKDALAARLADWAGEVGPAAQAPAPESAAAQAERAGRTRAFVKVQDGCRHRCTFCIVTVARGAERSRPIAEVVAEIRALERAGYREVVLTGVHLGGFGADRSEDLRALVAAVLADTDIPRVRLSSLEPWDLPPGFFDLWRNPRLMPHLHLPLQSGSDAVLRRMARRCSTDAFDRLVAEARAAIPDLTVTTDLIVGFPGETDADHAATLAFAERIGFGHIHIFAYSPRPGTAAARMPGHLPAAVKQARSRELHALAARLKRAHLARFVGSVRPVLWEGDAGYTDNYLRVRAAAGSFDNVIAPVRLERISDDGDAYEVAARVAASPGVRPRVRLRVV